MNWLRETTGIYGLGFNKESFFGIMLPLVIVGGVAVLAVVVHFLSTR